MKYNFDNFPLFITELDLVIKQIAVVMKNAVVRMIQ